MNLRDLQYLVMVAELRSFSKAAIACHISQPTLSGQIKKLEESLGISVFERNNKQVMPTETGEQIIRSAKKILKEVAVMQEIAESARDPLTGSFRLGAFPTLATYLFPQLVAPIREAMPALRLILMEEKTAMLQHKLQQGELDAAFMAMPIEDDSLASMELFSDIFFLAVPAAHPLANRKSIRQEMLQSYRLLLLDEGHCLRDQALDVCQLHGIGEEQDFRATGLETLRQMVKAGTGITLMPKMAIQEQEKDIIYIPFEHPKPERVIGLFWRKTTPKLPVIQTLIRLMQPLPFTAPSKI